MNIQTRVSWLKLAKLMTIIGWVLLIFAIGSFFMIMSSWLLFCVLVSREKVAKSILILFFNGLTLGIWGFIVANQELKQIEANMHSSEPDPQPSAESLYKGYKVAKILGLLSICIPIIGWFVIAPIAGVFTGVQEARQKRFGYAVCLMAFNTWTLGIWGFIVASKRKKQFAILKDQPQVVEVNEVHENNEPSFEDNSSDFQTETESIVDNSNANKEVKGLPNKELENKTSDAPKFEYNEHQD